MNGRAGARHAAGLAVERVRWDVARGDGERAVLIEFTHSPDYEPIEPR